MEHNIQRTVGQYQRCNTQMGIPEEEGEDEDRKEQEKNLKQ